MSRRKLRVITRNAMPTGSCPSCGAPVFKASDGRQLVHVGPWESRRKP